jgi:hypothetical protein
MAGFSPFTRELFLSVHYISETVGVNLAESELDPLTFDNSAWQSIPPEADEEI